MQVNRGNPDHTILILGINPLILYKTVYCIHKIKILVPCGGRVSVCVDKNFNLGHNFLLSSDRALILHMCSPCDKTFHMVS